MENELAAPRAGLVRLTRSEAARYVGACGESTIRAAEAKGLPLLYDAEGQAWHCPLALDAWNWRKQRPSNAQRERVIREATKARTREAHEQERRLALQAEREMAEWDAERARNDARDQAEGALRKSVRRRNEEERAAFELTHLNERTAGMALGFKSYETRHYLHDLVNRGLLRRVDGPREIQVSSLDELREVETNWPLCEGGPFYLREEVLALRREASAIAGDASRNGSSREEPHLPDNLLAEVLRLVLCAR